MSLKNNWESIFPFIVAFGDILSAWMAVHIGWWIWFGLISLSPAHGPSQQSLKMTVLAVLLAGLVLGGGQRRAFRVDLTDQLTQIIRISLSGLATTAILVFAIKEYNFSRGYIVVYFVTAALVLSLSRLICDRVKIGLMDNGWGVKNALIVGNNEAVRDIVDHLSAHRAFGYQIVGILTDDQRDIDCLYRDIRTIGSVADCEKLISEKQVGQVFIPDLAAGPADYDALITTCNLNNVEVRLVSHKVDLLARVAGIHDMPGFSLPGLPCRGFSVAYYSIKRFLDLMISGIGLVLYSPLLLLIAIVIKLDSPGSVFFRQRRIKQGGKCFWMYKFRTMREGSETIREAGAETNVKREGPIFKTRQDPRITRAGRWLRRLSLDELPQLINVFKGEMSLVGPRPPLPWEVEHYQEWHKYRLNGPQGMTGLWQVSGRSELSFEEMVLLDIYYLEHWSPLMDLEIMVKTIPAVITAKGAY